MRYNSKIGKLPKPASFWEDKIMIDQNLRGNEPILKTVGKLPKPASFWEDKIMIDHNLRVNVPILKTVGKIVRRWPGAVRRLKEKKDEYERRPLEVKMEREKLNTKKGKVEKVEEGQPYPYNIIKEEEGVFAYVSVECAKFERSEEYTLGQESCAHCTKEAECKEELKRELLREAKRMKHYTEMIKEMEQTKKEEEQYQTKYKRILAKRPYISIDEVDIAYRSMRLVEALERQSNLGLDNPAVYPPKFKRVWGGARIPIPKTLFTLRRMVMYIQREVRVVKTTQRYLAKEREKAGKAGDMRLFYMMDMHVRVLNIRIEEATKYLKNIEVLQEEGMEVRQMNAEYHLYADKPKARIVNANRGHKLRGDKYEEYREGIMESTKLRRRAREAEKIAPWDDLKARVVEDPASLEDSHGWERPVPMIIEKPKEEALIKREPKEEALIKRDRV